MTTSMKGTVFGAVLLAGATLHAQQAPAPPIRPLGAVVATSNATFGPMVTVRALPSGVLVNDVRNRRVVMLDSALTNLTAVADTSSATANAYSGQTANIIPFRADSTLFVDPQSMSMLVIDPKGQVGRVMSVPRSEDAMMLGSVVGGAAWDGRGGLVYRGSPFSMMRRQMMQRAPAGGPGGPGGPVFTPPDIPDSTAILRVDLASRQVDTLAWVKVPKIKMDVQRDDNGRVSMTAIANPLPTVDEFTVLSDGSVAFLRGRDYHVEWIRPDGTRETTPKIPFEWRRLSDEDKVAFLDSVKAARERMAEQARARHPQPADTGARHGQAADTSRRAQNRDMLMGGGGPGGMPGQVRVQIGGPGGGGAMMGTGGGAALNLVPASDLPDYQPVFFSGAVRADADGNLWVRTIPTKSLPGGPVYHVINAAGQLVDRIQVPKDRSIVGFGAGGVVYLAATQGETTTLERARVR